MFGRKKVERAHVEGFVAGVLFMQAIRLGPRKDVMLPALLSQAGYGYFVPEAEEIVAAARRIADVFARAFVHAPGQPAARNDDKAEVPDAGE